MQLGEVRAGARAVAPMLVGVVPFGLLAGAAPGERGLGSAAAVGLSTIVFAGASQFAAIDVLGDGGSALLAAMAAWTINLRMVLYSASLAPLLSKESLRTRLGLAYVLTDQAYAIAVARWDGNDEPKARVPYYLGGALLLWGSWQFCTIVGAVVGPSIPEDIPLHFAVPLVFLVLLIPALNGPPAIVAALVGGFGAVVAAELGAGTMSLMIGAVAGIAAGTVADAGRSRRLPPPRSLDVALEPEPDPEP